jgi:TPR repeat protein
MLSLGQNLADGKGIRKDLSEAKRYIQMSAEAGNPVAKSALIKILRRQTT